VGIRQTVAFAWGGIAANKMRSLLTMLGIVIGVASVITLIAVGTGSQAAVQASISRLGSNTLYVLPMPTGTGGHGSALQQRLRKMLGISSKPDNSTHDMLPQLRFADAQALADPKQVPDVSAVAPLVVLHNVIGINGNSSHTTAVLLGGTSNYFAIDDDTTSAGRFFTQAENATHAHVAVVGVSVASDLVTGDDADLIGQTIRFNGQPFTVIGILGSKGYSGQTDLDDKVVVPISAAQDALYGYSPSGAGELSAVAVEASSAGRTEAAQTEVQSLMDERDHVSAVDSQVVVFNSAAILSASSSSSKTLTILLAAVAGISLLVGGIGVMNIMLVSVTERTREIGIRKAIGAQARAIVGQFLAEAVIVSMVGGLIGVAVGFGAAHFTIIGIHPIVAPWSVYLSLAVSLFTGLFFGLYPAQRAASLRPIEALRYE
jgi:putative ABC transport system permease protein